MTKKDELKEQFEEAWGNVAQKEEAAMALTTSGSLSLVTWGDRDTVIATGIRIKTVLPGGDKLSIPQALAAGQYAVATGLNPIRGEFYPMVDNKGRFSIVDGYKALTRWAQDECPYDVQYRKLQTEKGEAYRIKCIIMRDDRREKLDYYLERGADFQTAFDLVTTSAVGVVGEYETRNDPPKGWTWEQRAETRALKNALNRSHGMPTVAELARKSWEVAGILTKPEDWEGGEHLATQEERERHAELTARARETTEAFEAMSPEEQQEKLAANRALLYGQEDEADPYGDVIDAEIIGEAPPEDDNNSFGQVGDEHKEEPIEPEKEPMTLGQALGIALHTDAPRLGLERGDYLLEAVRVDAKDFIEYLTKSSSYQHQTVDGMEVQRAATVILDNWDRARQVVQKEEAGEPIEEMVVGQGDTPPLF